MARSARYATPMNTYRSILVVVSSLLMTVALTACSKSGGSAQAPVALGNGVIEGTITLDGKPPAKKLLQKDAKCGTQTMDIYDDAVLVGPGGGLKNVIVYLKNTPPAGDGSTKPPVVLDQVGCEYSPRVVAVQTGQTLHIINSDNTIHNVHTESKLNPVENLAMPNSQSKFDLTFSKPEIFPVKCDVHPWMAGVIGVFPNPFFAVTDGQGHFKISQVPPGTYTLVAHHERYGDLDKTITVTSDGKVVTADLAYKAPTKP